MVEITVASRIRTRSHQVRNNAKNQSFPSPALTKGRKAVKEERMNQSDRTRVRRLAQRGDRKDRTTRGKRSTLRMRSRTERRGIDLVVRRSRKRQSLGVG